MNPRTFTGFTLVLLILAGSAAYIYTHPSIIGLPTSYAEQQADSNSLFPGSTSTPVTSIPTSNPTTGGKKSPTSESLTGTIACLPYPGDGPHTMECAIGIKTDQGLYYALTNFQYPTQADVGEHIRLTGVTVTTDEFHAKYDIVGTFQVATVEKL